MQSESYYKLHYVIHLSYKVTAGVNFIPYGRTHGAPFRGYGYVPLRNGGNVVRRMGTQQQQQQLYSIIHLAYKVTAGVNFINAIYLTSKVKAGVNLKKHLSDSKK